MVKQVGPKIVTSGAMEAPTIALNDKIGKNGKIGHLEPIGTRIAKWEMVKQVTSLKWKIALNGKRGKMVKPARANVHPLSALKYYIGKPGNSAEVSKFAKWLKR